MGADRPRFHGWTMLGVAIAMGIATMPGQTVVVSLFNTSYREALGLSVTQLSAAYTAGTILAALPLSLVGKAADRFGLRIVTAAVTLAFAGALAMQSRVDHVVMLGVGFFFIRFLGQGSLGMLSGHTIAMWFERKLGTVHSFHALGFAAGSAIMPIPVAWLIEHHGWRPALLVLAGFVLLLVMPPVLTVFRNKPEDIGQHLDGDPVEHETHDVMHGGPPPPSDPALTARQAMASRAYWIIVPIMLASGLIGTALLFHMQTMLQAGGIEGTEIQAAAAIQPWPIAFAVGTMIAGPLADRLRPSMLLGLSPVVMGASCLICLAAAAGFAPEGWTVALMGTGMGVFGVSQAISVAVGNPTIARYFGRTHHGAIRGTVTTLMVAGTGTGPLMAGAAYDLANKSFTPILIVFTAVCVPLAVSTIWLRPPAPPRVRDLTPDPDEPDPPGVAV